MATEEPVFDEASIEHIKKKLLVWGKTHLRKFPWRETQDPYAVLVAEVLLHRTQAAQVAPIYTRFMMRYPRLSDLAKASLGDLETMLYPLGLRWRIPLIKNMANQIETDFNSEIPTASNLLQTLPGVGPYIASATICFAFELPEIILDTNTVRILGRLRDIPINDGSRRSKKFRTLMWMLLDQDNSRLFNLSLLDLAALVCLPALPQCESCPINEECDYGRKQLAPTD